MGDPLFAGARAVVERLWGESYDPVETLFGLYMVYEPLFGRFSRRVHWAERPRWHLFEDGCPGGETLLEVSARADRVIARVHALRGDVLIFAHRDILRVLAVRWVALFSLEARRLDLGTASFSVLGYDHDLDGPVIRILTDARGRARALPAAR